MRDEEFVKRAGFSLMATLAVHYRKASSEAFEQFLPVISKGAEEFENCSLDSLRCTEGTGKRICQEKIGIIKDF